MTTSKPLNAATLWPSLCKEAEAAARREPMLAADFHTHILRHKNFAASLANVLADRLADNHHGLDAEKLATLFEACFAADAGILVAAKKDALAVLDRDPAADRAYLPLLRFKGYQALQTHRAAHHLWQAGRKDMALWLQSRSSARFQVDIHPAARVGQGIMLDHAAGIVIGETAVVGDDVSMLHNVTLGGTGKENGDRHPKIGKGVIIGAGATILGNIAVGEGARIAAGSMIRKPVPPHVMVAGNPAAVMDRITSLEDGRIVRQMPRRKPSKRAAARS